MLGIRLKSLRKDAGLSQQELAKKIGVGRTTITEYERETIVPPYDKIVALSKIFDVTVKYLTGETNSKNEEILDVHDLSEQIDNAIDMLEQSDLVVKFNNRVLTVECKHVAAEQLKQTKRMIDMLNKVNTP